MTTDDSVDRGFRGPVRMVVLAILFVAAAGFYRWRISSSGDAMQQVATELGLSLSQQGQRWRMQGDIDNMGVTVKTTPENLGGDTRWFTDFTIDAIGQPTGRILGSSFRQTILDTMGGSNWLATGDSNFDSAVLVEGDPAEMMAHLDAKTREAVIKATSAGWVLENGTWTARESGPLNNASKIRSLIETGVAAAGAMPLDGDLSEALRNQSENDPIPGVRATASTLLEQRELVTRENAVEIVKTEVDSPRSLEAAIQLARAGNPLEEVKIRLNSALYAGERQKEVIVALGQIGGLIEIAALNGVKGEHEALAKKAVAEIKKRLESEKQKQ